MVNQPISRFDIWLVQLGPTQGHEIKKTRPCVVNFPTRIQCTFQGKKGLIILDQIRAVDKLRLVKKLGVISKTTQIKVCDCLQELFAY